MKYVVEVLWDRGGRTGEINNVENWGVTQVGLQFIIDGGKEVIFVHPSSCNSVVITEVEG